MPSMLERATTRLRPKLPAVNRKPASETDTGSNKTANKPAGRTRKPTTGMAIRFAGIPRGVNR